MVRYQQQLKFNKTLGFIQLVKIIMDPALIIIILFTLAIYFVGKLTSQYIVLSTIVFALSFPGSWTNSASLGKDIFSTLTQWLVIVAILFFFGYATTYIDQFPHQLILSWILITPICLVFAHLMMRNFLNSRHYILHATKTAVIVGFNDLGKQLKSRLLSDPQNKRELKGFFDDIDMSQIGSVTLDKNELIGRISQMADYVKRNAIEIIYIAIPSATYSSVIAVLDELKDTTASIYFVPDFFMTDLIQARIDEVDGMPIVAMCETPFVGFDGVIKRISDVLISFLILVLTAPIMLFLAFGVKLTSSGPVLFKQRRYGLDGQEITIYKFRSMIVAEDGAIVTQATKGDLRVTRLGQFIRKTSLDELPQFINVLQGCMSIVGPRPHAVSHNEMYRKLIKGYMIRHKVKPGITGWAQVNGFRGEIKSINCMQSRIEYDLEYLRKWSFSLDIKIIVRSIFLIFKDKNAF